MIALVLYGLGVLLTLEMYDIYDPARDIGPVFRIPLALCWPALVVAGTLWGVAIELASMLDSGK